MEIPRYWARGFYRSNEGGKEFEFACWRWSDLSVDDARRLAEARAFELAARWRSKSDLDRYHYGEQPLREEIVQKIAGDDGNDLAVITRNIYGALVLNAANAMFIDLDFREVPGEHRWWHRFIGSPRLIESEEPCLERFRSWAAQYPKLCIRVYRTCAGLRCLVTNQMFDPKSPDTIALLNEMGSDPLYVRLCQAQACFRARLTPKPWRCAYQQPPSRFPWADSKQEVRYRQWQSFYERKTRRYSVCRLIEEIGRAEVHPLIQPIVALHDQFACARSEHPLA